MPLFRYVGSNAATGKKLKGTIEADSIKDARQKLRKQSIYVSALDQDKGSATAQGGGGILAQLQRRPPRQEDIAFATKQFSIMVRSAVDISDSLKLISDQVENAELKSIYAKIRDMVSEGKTLSDAHREFPRVFSPIYTNMLSAAEKAGALALVLKRLSDFISYQIEIKRKVIGALTYPIMMLLVAFGVTIFLFVSVLPKITKALTSLKVVLPWYTVLINDFSAWLQSYWLICIAVAVVSGLLFAAWARTPKGRYKTHGWMLKAPIAGAIVQRVAISRVMKTLSTVLASGVRIVEGLTLARNVVGNAILEEALDKAIQSVQDGDKLAAAMEKTKVFPPLVVQMIRTGEKTGKLEEMLVNIAEAYDDEVNDKISMSTKLIEPIMLIFLAGLVVLIVMAVMGPMMQAMNTMK